MLIYVTKIVKGDESVREQNNFFAGIKDGLPICLGYLSVAFAFGITAVNAGLDIWQAVLISMLNVTSAGQLAGVPIIVTGGTLVELALAQLVINLRYSLMSISLSQKFGKSVRLVDKFSFPLLIQMRSLRLPPQREQMLAENICTELL